MYHYYDAEGCPIDVDDLVENEAGGRGIVLDYAAGEVLVEYQDYDAWEYPGDLWVL
jgi:hypothetical protein